MLHNCSVTLKMADSINSDSGKYTIEIDIGPSRSRPRPEKVLILISTRIFVKSSFSGESPAGRQAFSDRKIPSGHILTRSTTQSFRVPYEDLSSDQQHRRKIAMTILELTDIPFRLEDQQAEFSVGMNETKLLKSFEEVVTGLDEFLHGLSPESMLNKFVGLDLRKIFSLPEKEFEAWNSYWHNRTDKYATEVFMLPQSRISWRILTLSILDRPREEELGCGGCLICLEDVKPPLLIKLPCGHIYHQYCILRWIQNNRSCPFCRAETPEIPALDGRRVGAVLLSRHQRAESNEFPLWIL